MQLDIFSVLYEKIRIDKKPIRIYEFFAGIGAFHSAIDRLSKKGAIPLGYESMNICEWAIPSIIAYASIHRDSLNNYGIDYTVGMTKDEIAIELHNMGVSSDYNKPAELDYLKRMGLDKLKLIYNSIKWSNNLVDITRVNGKDLEIDSNYTNICMCSSPCQNLSVAGKMDNLKDREEINNDNVYALENRSNMLWQFERILKEMDADGKHFDCILMENVKGLVSPSNKKQFDALVNQFQELNYYEKHDVLNGKDYGVPQNRVRVYIVATYGEYDYTFPKKEELKIRLKDVLEKNVDEKYYLSENMKQYISKVGGGGYANADARINLEIARPLTTVQNKRAGTTNYLCDECP